MSASRVGGGGSGYCVSRRGSIWIKYTGCGSTPRGVGSPCGLRQRLRSDPVLKPNPLMFILKPETLSVLGAHAAECVEVISSKYYAETLLT